MDPIPSCEPDLHYLRLNLAVRYDRVTARGYLHKHWIGGVSEVTNTTLYEACNYMNWWNV